MDTLVEVIKVLVKGDAEQAQAALEARGLDGVPLGSRPFGSTLWAVPASSYPAVVAWMCEPAVCEQGSGFPPGTLLLHGPLAGGA